MMQLVMEPVAKYDEKEAFINTMKRRTKTFAVDCIGLCNGLKGTASNIITYQLIKSATSTGANYSALCNSRSRKEFFSKMRIVSEELDESIYWLDLIKDIGLSQHESELLSLKNEAISLLKIVNSAKSSTYQNKAS